jgi:transcriptional regulator with XRE-family HTH domain
VNKIQDYREAAGLTQEGLAEILKVDRSTIAKWESGVSLPRADKLPNLAKLLKCTVDDLLKDS